MTAGATAALSLAGLILARANLVGMAFFLGAVLITAVTFLLFSRRIIFLGLLLLLSHYTLLSS